MVEIKWLVVESEHNSNYWIGDTDTYFSDMQEALNFYEKRREIDFENDEEDSYGYCHLTDIFLCFKYTSEGEDRPTIIREKRRILKEMRKEGYISIWESEKPGWSDSEGYLHFAMSFTGELPLWEDDSHK